MSDHLKPIRLAVTVEFPKADRFFQGRSEIRYVRTLALASACDAVNLLLADLNKLAHATVAKIEEEERERGQHGKHSLFIP